MWRRYSIFFEPFLYRDKVAILSLPWMGQYQHFVRVCVERLRRQTFGSIKLEFTAQSFWAEDDRREPLPWNRANVRVTHFIWKHEEDIDSSQLLLCLRSVAAWCDAPDTQFLLDFIRPDFLLLRVSSVTVMCAAGQVQCLAMSSSFLIFSARLSSFNWVLISI